MNSFSVHRYLKGESESASSPFFYTDHSLFLFLLFFKLTVGHLFIKPSLSRFGSWEAYPEPQSRPFTLQSKLPRVNWATDRLIGWTSCIHKSDKAIMLLHPTAQYGDWNWCGVVAYIADGLWGAWIKLHKIVEVSNSIFHVCLLIVNSHSEAFSRLVVLVLLL